MSLALLKKRPIAEKTPPPPRPEPLRTKKQLQKAGQNKRARARKKEKVEQLVNDVASRDDDIRQLKASVATLTAQNQAFAHHVSTILTVGYDGLLRVAHGLQLTS